MPYSSNIKHPSDSILWQSSQTCPNKTIMDQKGSFPILAGVLWCSAVQQWGKPCIYLCLPCEYCDRISSFQHSLFWDNLPVPTFCTPLVHVLAQSSALLKESGPQPSCVCSGGLLRPPMGISQPLSLWMCHHASKQSLLFRSLLDPGIRISVVYMNVNRGSVFSSASKWRLETQCAT